MHNHVVNDLRILRFWSCNLCTGYPFSDQHILSDLRRFIQIVLKFKTQVLQVLNFRRICVNNYCVVSLLNWWKNMSIWQKTTFTAVKSWRRSIGPKWLRIPGGLSSIGMFSRYLSTLTWFIPQSFQDYPDSIFSKRIVESIKYVSTSRGFFPDSQGFSRFLVQGPEVVKTFTKSDKISAKRNSVHWFNMSRFNQNKTWQDCAMSER